MNQLARSFVFGASAIASVMTVYLSMQVLALFGLFGAAGQFFGSFDYLDQIVGPLAFLAVLFLIIAAVVVLYPWVPIILGFIGGAKNKPSLMAVSAFLYVPVLGIFIILISFGQDYNEISIPPLIAYLAAFGLALAGWIIKTKEDKEQHEK